MSKKYYKEYSIKYYQEHREEILQKKKIERKENPEKLEELREKDRKYYWENKERISKRKKKKYENRNEEQIEEDKNKKKKYRENPENKESIKRIKRKYNAKENTKKKRNERKKIRLQNDPVYKLSTNLRNRIRIAFHEILNISKNKKTFEMIGLTAEETKKYIENKFTKGMNWDNYGKYENENGDYVNGWDIDHIIPLSSAKTEEEIIRLCHYTNLQPLWHKENMEKGNKIPKEKKCILQEQN